jgi:hypothetical protein
VQTERRGQISALGEAVDGISSSEDVGDQAASLEAIFQGARQSPALTTVPAAASAIPRPGARPRPSRVGRRGTKTIAPELDRVLQPDRIYAVTISLAAAPSVAEVDRLVYYLSVLDGVRYRHDRRRKRILVQDITGRDIRVVAGFSGIRRIASAGRRTR